VRSQVLEIAVSSTFYVINKLESHILDSDAERIDELEDWFKEILQNVKQK
jgi:hypothetical protein